MQRWLLSPQGRAHAQNLARTGWPGTLAAIISSAETKALETARILAAPGNLPVTVRPGMHENDRSATGYLPPEHFEAVVDEFFARPAQSIRGWETALAAQARIVAETRAVLRDSPAGNLLLVGHGAVGTLLMCHLAGLPIYRRHDQPGKTGGAAFSFARDSMARPDAAKSPKRSVTAWRVENMPAIAPPTG